MKQAAAVLCLLVFPLGLRDLRVAEAQTAVPNVTDSANWAWDPPTTDARGDPATPLSYEFGIWSGTVADLNAAAAPMPLKILPEPLTAATSLSVLATMTGVKGGTYTFGVRALNAGGPSKWSPPLTQTYVRPTAAPQNLRLTVTITP